MSEPQQKPTRKNLCSVHLLTAAAAIPVHAMSLAVHFIAHLNVLEMKEKNNVQQHRLTMLASSVDQSVLHSVSGIDLHGFPPGLQ